MDRTPAAGLPLVRGSGSGSIPRASGPRPTVADLIDGAFDAMQLIAGSRGSGRPVEQVLRLTPASLGTADLSSSIVALVGRSGRLVVPTVAVAVSIAERNAAAVVVPRTRRLDPALTRQADRSGLPILVMPAEATLGALAAHLAEAGLRAMQLETHQRQAVAELVLAALVGDISVEALLDAVGGLVGLQLSLTRANGRRIAGSPGGGDVVARLPVVVGGRTTAVLTANLEVADVGEVVDGEVVDGATFTANRAQSTGPNETTDAPAEASATPLLAPLASALASILAGEDDSDDPREYERRLLREMVGSDLSRREQAMRFARGLPTFPVAPFEVLVVQPVATMLTPQALGQLVRHLEVEVMAADPRGVVTDVEGSITVLVSSGVRPERLARTLGRRLRIPVVVGLGRQARELRSLPGSHRQAVRAASLGRRLHRAGSVLHYSDLGAYQLLSLVPEHERNSFAVEVLGSLAERTAAASESRRTLHVLLETNFNLALASRRLFVHYNTLRYRLQRLIDEIGDVQHDAERRLAVHMALAMLRLDADELSA